MLVGNKMLNCVKTEIKAKLLCINLMEKLLGGPKGNCFLKWRSKIQNFEFKIVDEL